MVLDRREDGCDGRRPADEIWLLLLFLLKAAITTDDRRPLAATGLAVVGQFIMFGDIVSLELLLAVAKPPPPQPPSLSVISLRGDRDMASLLLLDGQQSSRLPGAPAPPALLWRGLLVTRELDKSSGLSASTLSMRAEGPAPAAAPAPGRPPAPCRPPANGWPQTQAPQRQWDHRWHSSSRRG